MIYYPDVMGHRGVRGQSVPENSIPAFLEAIQQGAGGIELDARICRTGEIVVFHDKILDNLSDGSGRVKLTDFATIRKLRLERKDVQIPTLDEVLDAVEPHLHKDRRFLVNVEIKGKDSPQAVVDIVSRKLEDGAWRPENFTISHFHHDRLEVVKKQLPEVAIGLLFTQTERSEKKMYEAIMPLAEKWRAATINLPIACYIKSSLSERLQDQDLVAVAWTKDEQPPRSRPHEGTPQLDVYARIVVEQGVKLITDYPYEMRMEINAARRLLPKLKKHHLKIITQRSYFAKKGIAEFPICEPKTQRRNPLL